MFLVCVLTLVSCETHDGEYLNTDLKTVGTELDGESDEVNTEKETDDTVGKNDGDSVKLPKDEF